MTSSKQRVFSYIRARIYIRKTVDGTECQLLLDTGASKSFMSKIILHALQVTSFFAKIFFKDKKNSGRKWTICQCIIYNASNYRCACTQI